MNIRRRVVGLICLCILPASISCNGGSKDAVPEAPRLQVTSTSPSDNATGVPIDNSVSVSFSEGIDPATITSATFRLTVNGDDVPGVVTSSGDSAFFTPVGNLAPLAEYVARVTVGIKDLAGDSLATDYSWSFSTQDGSWDPAIRIEDAGDNQAIDPRVGVGSNGDAVAVWVTALHDHVWAIRYSDEDGWGAEQTVDASIPGQSQVSGPQIAVDSRGDAVAVWRQSSAEGAKVWANRYVSGSGWGSALQIEDNFGSAAGLQVAMDNFGKAFVVWSQWDGSEFSLWSNRFDPAVGWGVPVILVGTGDASNPAIAVDGGGNAIVVWEQSDGITANILAVRYDAGTGWSLPQLIESGSGSAGSPRIAMNANGTAFVAWQQVEGTTHRISANRYRVGSGWETAQLVENAAPLESSRPVISVDGSGNAIVVYNVVDSVQVHAWVNVFNNGSGWGVPRPLGPASKGSLRPQAVMDEYGNGMASWLQEGETVGSITLWVSRFGREAGWGTPQQLTEGSASVGIFLAQPEDLFYGLAMNRRGAAIVIWPQYDQLYSNWGGVWGDRFH